MRSDNLIPRFPRGFAILLGLLAGGLIGGGMILWTPSSGGASTADSDLGLALVSGGLALGAGAAVSYVVFVAQSRFELAQRASEERANLQLTLSATDDLTRVDLRGRDPQWHRFERQGHESGRP